jgi:3-hydroxybenzoate 6-monooxygenase
MLLRRSPQNPCYVGILAGEDGLRPTEPAVLGFHVTDRDAAHPPLQYMTQGAIMAIEDGWVLAEHVGRQAAPRTGHSLGVDWDAPGAAYEAVRPERCRRVVETARDWGDLWHLDGEKCEQCDPAGADHLRLFNRGRIFGPTALTPKQEPEPYQTIPLASAEA